jgi:uncharacterized membrane protein
MKQLLTVLALGTLLATIGCNGSGTSGGPGATNRDRNGDRDSGVHVTQPENTFSLSVPTLGTSIKQGERNTVKIGISRGKNFDGDVKLSFDGLPQGASISPAHPTIDSSEKEETVTLEAAKDAPLGDFTITVKGKPSKGPEATNTFKITVKKP